MATNKKQGATPAPLAKFNRAGGTDGMQTLYDIPLVDDYNLPLSINYIHAENTAYIPPNLTNPAYIATSGWLYAPNETGINYSDSSYPILWGMQETNKSVQNWCPCRTLPSRPPSPGTEDPATSILSLQECLCCFRRRQRLLCRRIPVPRRAGHPVTVKKPRRFAQMPTAVPLMMRRRPLPFPKGRDWEVVMCPQAAVD